MMISGSNRAVLTLATGKPLYIEMAVNLARSFKWWHKSSNIRFILATDQKDLLPPDLDDIEIIELMPGKYGLGFSPKLYLDQISPAEQTLFIDADCLCVGSLEPVFEKFLGHSVSVVGKLLDQGEFFGNIESVCSQFKIPNLHYFVGGLYYFEKGEVTHQIYEMARALESRYDEIGLVRLRGRPNEEPLMAIAMSMYAQTPLLEDGSIKAEPMFYPSGMTVDVVRGQAKLLNLPNHPKYSTTWGLQKSSPKIVHFHCSYIHGIVYTREVLKLQKIMADGWAPWLANVYAILYSSFPKMLVNFLKNIFRPLYHRLFGARPINVSDRIVGSEP